MHPAPIIPAFAGMIGLLRSGDHWKSNMVRNRP